MKQRQLQTLSAALVALFTKADGKPNSIPIERKAFVDKCEQLFFGEGKGNWKGLRNGVVAGASEIAGQQKKYRWEFARAVAAVEKWEQAREAIQSMRKDANRERAVRKAKRKGGEGVSGDDQGGPAAAQVADSKGDASVPVATPVQEVGTGMPPMPSFGLAPFYYLCCLRIVTIFSN